MGYYCYTHITAVMAIWLVVSPFYPIWKIWVRQLGWWNSQCMEKKTCSKFQTTSHLLVINGYFNGLIHSMNGMISTYNCPFGPFCGFYPGKSRELVQISWSPAGQTSWPASKLAPGQHHGCQHQVWKAHLTRSWHPLRRCISFRNLWKTWDQRDNSI